MITYFSADVRIIAICNLITLGGLLVLLSTFIWRFVNSWWHSSLKQATKRSSRRFYRTSVHCANDAAYFIGFLVQFLALEIAAVGGMVMTAADFMLDPKGEIVLASLPILKGESVQQTFNLVALNVFAGFFFYSLIWCYIIARTVRRVQWRKIRRQRRYKRLLEKSKPEKLFQAA